MRIKLNVTGMTCAACSARVEKVSRQIDGVDNADVNLLAGTLQADVTSLDVAYAMIGAITDAGYGASVAADSPKKIEPVDDALRFMKKRVICSAVFLTILMYFTMGHMVGLPIPDWYHGQENAMVAAMLQFFLTLPVVILNRAYYLKGLKALWMRSPNMDSLVAVGSGAALVYGVAVMLRMGHAMGHGRWDVVVNYSENLYFESAAMILTLITLGKFLETRAKNKTGDAIRQLMDLSPKTATILQNGEELTLPVEQVAVGDIVVVRSGGSIPVDGTVVSGRAAVDQGALTGESIPVEKVEGDTVAAATVITEGYVQIRVNKTGDDTTLAQIIHLVEEAGGSKAPIARMADKIAGIFVPIVMTVAAVTFAVWMLAGQDLEFAMTAGICVLVISCPCALGLATPVAIMVGTGRGAQMGILFKNARALENLHNVDTVVLDKTGTLTVGKPAVTDIFAGAFNKEALIHVAASLEAGSEHPFAKAILAAANNTYEKAEDFHTLPGRGISAVINGIRYYGGNLRLMEEIGVCVPDCAHLAKQGKTPIYFADENGRFLGAVAAADVLKEDSPEAIAQLRVMGIDVVMLTGDNKDTANSVAECAGITHVIADVLPADKAGAVSMLKDEGRKVLMVGDGINDAPALVTADVGMAIGAGTDIAIESADVVLMRNSLTDVCRAISLSNATIRNIRQNLFWAFFYNCLGIPVAAGVLYPSFGILLSPMLGAAAMSMSSVFVVTNALRLRLFKDKSTKRNCSEIIENTVEEKQMQTVIMVEGMMCTHCKARVESVCKTVSGVTDAVVDLQAKNVTVTGSVSLDELKKVITDAGYEVVG